MVWVEPTLTARIGDVLVGTASGNDTTKTQATTPYVGGPLLLGGEQGIYRFDANDHNVPSAGLTQDTSGNGRHLTRGGAVSVGVGRFNACYTFINNVDSELIRNASGLDTTGDCSMVGWIKPTEMELSTIAGTLQAGGGTDAYHLEMTAAGKIRYHHLDTTIDSVSTVSTGRFYMVGFIRDATAKTIEIIVDGVIESPQTYTNNPNASPNFYVGERSDGAAHFRGQIDELRVYHRKLSTAEVVQLRVNPYDTSNAPRILERIHNDTSEFAALSDRLVTRAVSDATEWDDTSDRHISKLTTDQLLVNDQDSRDITKVVSDISQFADAFSRHRERLVTDQSQFEVTFSRDITHTTSDTSKFISTFLRNLSRTISDTITYDTDYNTFTARSAIGVVQFTDAFFRDIARQLTDTGLFISALQHRQLDRLLTDTALYNDGDSRDIIRTHTDTIQFVDIVSRDITRIHNDIVEILVEMGRDFTRSYTDTVKIDDVSGSGTVTNLTFEDYFADKALLEQFAWEFMKLHCAGLVLQIMHRARQTTTSGNG